MKQRKTLSLFLLAGLAVSIAGSAHGATDGGVASGIVNYIIRLLNRLDSESLRQIGDWFRRRAEMPRTSPMPPTTTSIPRTPPASTPARPTPAADPDDNAAELAQVIAIPGIAPIQGAFGKLFDAVVPVIVDGENIFQQTLATVKQQLQQKSALARQALQAAGQARAELVGQAQKAFADAQNAARQLVQTIQQRGPELIRVAVKELFNIDYQQLQQKTTQLAGSVQKVQQRLTNFIKAMEPVQKIQRNWNAVQVKGTALAQQWPDLLKQLAARKHDQTGYFGWLGFGSKTDETSAEFQANIKKYPLAYKLDALYKVYRDLIASVEQTEPAFVGMSGNLFLSILSQVFIDLSQLYTETETWGKLLLNPELVSALGQIGVKMKAIGNIIKTIALSDPFETLLREIPKDLTPTSIAQWLGTMSFRPSEMLNASQDIMNKQKPIIMEAKEKTMEAIEQTTNLAQTFVEHSSKMMGFIGYEILEKLRANPLQNYISVAKQAVAKEAKISKDLFNDVLLGTASIVNYTTKMISPTVSAIMQSNIALGKEFVSVNNLENLEGINVLLKELLQQLNTVRQEIKKINI